MKQQLDCVNEMKDVCHFAANFRIPSTNVGNSHIPSHWHRHDTLHYLLGHLVFEVTIFRYIIFGNK